LAGLWAAKGFMAGGMAKTTAGDWRDDEQITTWAYEIGIPLVCHDAP
jgi:hypothetical protein